MKTLDDKLREIVNDCIALGTDHGNNLPAAQNEDEAIAQIKTAFAEEQKENWVGWKISKKTKEYLKNRPACTPGNCHCGWSD